MTINYRPESKIGSRRSRLIRAERMIEKVAEELGHQRTPAGGAVHKVVQHLGSLLRDPQYTDALPPIPRGETYARDH